MNYSNMPKYYYITILIMIVVAIILIIIASSKLNPKIKTAILCLIAIFQLGFELYWRVKYYYTRGEKILSMWPFYVCNLNGILVPIAALTKNKTIKEMFYVFGFFGGIVALAVPIGLFSSSRFSFAILKTILQHTGIIFIPIFEYASGRFRPQLKNFWLAIVGMLVHVVNALVIAPAMGYPGDYLYFDSGVPFTITGVPGWVIVSVSAIIGVGLIYLLLNINKFFHKKAKPSKENLTV